jgi:hypothetical protein
MTTRAVVLAVGLVSTASFASKSARPAYDEAQLQRAYFAWVAELNTARVATDYGKAVRDLVSGEPSRQKAGLQTLSAAEEVEVVPWLVLFLDSPDLRPWAASALDQVISRVALKRRDPKANDVVLLPRRPSDPDLKPLTWIALRLLRMPGVLGNGATIARYVEARELEAELRAALGSRHPAESNHAWFALDALGFKDLPPDPFADRKR